MGVPFSLSILQLVFLSFITYTNGQQNEFFCLQKSFPNGTCIINEDSSKTCNGRGTFDKETLMCDCKAGWAGAYCEHCAFGVAKGDLDDSNNECTVCDNKKGFYGDVTTGGCHVCPCSPEGYEYITGTIDYPEWHLAADEPSDHPEPICLPDATPDIKANPNKLAVCNCKRGWSGPLCTVCADSYYPSPDLAKITGVPACSVHCDRALTCGDKNSTSHIPLGECSAMGECLCMPGARSLDGGCVRCVEGETEMQGGINMCARDFISSGPPAIPSPPDDTKSTKGSNKCKNKPKWWIGLIIAGAAALLLAIIAGVIIIAMTSKSAAPGDAA